MFYLASHKQGQESFTLQATSRDKKVLPSKPQAWDKKVLPSKPQEGTIKKSFTKQATSRNKNVLPN